MNGARLDSLTSLSDLGSLLKELAPSPKAWFRPNPGNAGDSLIALATFHLLRDLGVETRALRDTRSFDPEGQTLIYGGGGNLVHMYRGDARETISKFHRRLNRLIVLPSTVSGNEDLLAELGAGVLIFCRELVSYRYVRGCTRGASVLLSEDMAFGLSPERVESSKPMSFGRAVALKLVYRISRDKRHRDIPSPRRMRRCLPQLARLSRRARREGVLNCFRTDREGGSARRPHDNVDLSELCAFGAHSEPLASYSAYHLLASLKPFRLVRTNRLHVAIAGGLLGKEVEFYSNSYFKCRAVFEHSIAPRFSNVCWKGELGSGP